MGLWKPPAKVMLPSEFEGAAAQSLSPALFEYNGHLPDGTQLLAYVFTTPPDAAGRRHELAVVHEFDADGRYRLIRTRVAGPGDDSGRTLHEMVAPYLAAGWQAGDIWVRPFLIEIDGWPHGLVFEASGDGLEGDGGEECEDGPEGTVWLRPFGFPFHPPFDTGSYDT